MQLESLLEHGHDQDDGDREIWRYENPVFDDDEEYSELEMDAESEM